jgi:hypothetical protein
VAGIDTAIANSKLSHVSGFFSEALKDGSTIDMVVDGDSTPKNYDQTVPANSILVGARILVCYTTTAANFVPESTFAGGVVLPKGILLRVINAAGGIDQTINPDIPITKDIDFAHYAGRDIQTLRQANNKAAVVRFSLFKAARKSSGGFFLPAGWKIRVVIQDDLSTGVGMAVGEMKMTLQGELISGNS